MMQGPSQGQPGGKRSGFDHADEICMHACLHALMLVLSVEQDGSADL